MQTLGALYGSTYHTMARDCCVLLTQLSLLWRHQWSLCMAMKKIYMG